MHLVYAMARVIGSKFASDNDALVQEIIGLDFEPNGTPLRKWVAGVGALHCARDAFYCNR